MKLLQKEKKKNPKEVENKKENIRKLENLSRKSHIQIEDFQNKRAEMAKGKKFKRNYTGKFPRLERHLFSKERTHQVPSRVNEKRATSNYISRKSEHCGSEGRTYAERRQRSNAKDPSSGVTGEIR